MATMFGCSPTRSFNRPKSVASRFKERTRSARKQNLNTRSVLSLLSRPSQTSPKPPSPSFFFNTQPQQPSCSSGLGDAVTGSYMTLFAVDKAHLSRLELGTLLTVLALSSILVSAAFGHWL